MLDWSLRDDTFCTVGPKHIFFWDMKGNKKQGIFGGGSQQTNVLCVAFDNNGSAFTGA